MKLIGFFKKHQILWRWLLVGAAILGLISAVGARAKKIPAKSGTITIKAPAGRIDLTGTIRPYKAIYAVTIDNLKPARPQSGLDKAQLVIEAPVEGGVTRFLAFFSDVDVASKIGPVRSARPYFVDWASEYDALLAHVGGSAAALVMLSTKPSMDLNEMKNGQYFYRDKTRFAPHNAYTTTSLLLNAVRKNNFASQNINIRNFSSRAANNSGSGKQATIDFSTPDFKVVWTYNPANQSYSRTQGAAGYVPISAKNVIIQVVEASVIDSVGRLSIRTVGGGASVVLRDGLAYVGTWSKAAGSATTFMTLDGKGVPLKTGTTWIEAVPSSGSTYAIK